MSGISVVVQAPNWRKQTVKCTPNTTILQIIEEVCKKQGLNASEYDIKHHGKVLDTTTTFRFSGLPNNAQLELVAALKQRAEGNIILAVNLENGTRVTETFTPNDTLLNVLNRVCPTNVLPDSHPVVIYTRREIYGKELENCTLRSLGLVGGRAMIRVLNKDPELLREQANVSAPLPSKPVEEKPYIRKFEPLEDQPEHRPAEGSEADHAYGAGNRLGSSGGEKPQDLIRPDKNMKNPTVDILKLAKEKRKSLERSGSPPKRERKEPNDDMEVDSQPPNPIVEQQRSIEEEFVFCGERHGMVFSLESAQAVPSEELPDDFFALTIDDAKKILRDVKMNRHALENQVLKTSQLRNLDEAKKQLRSLNKYKKAIIRVQFPNRTVVQGIFKPTETVQDVVDFVRGYLEDQSIDFYIYSTPPKSVLNNESRLVEIGCVPGALLYFGSNGDPKSGFLRTELQSMFTTNSVASLAATRIRQENTRKRVDKEQDDEAFMDIDDSAYVPVNYGAGTSRDNAAAGAERKIVSNSADFPRWFKPL